MEDVQQASQLIEAFLRLKLWTSTLPASAEKAAILKASPAVQLEIVRAYYRTVGTMTLGPAYRSLVALLLARDLPTTLDDLMAFLTSGEVPNDYYANWVGLFRQVSRLSDPGGPPPVLREALLGLRGRFGPWDAERKRLRAQLEELLSPRADYLPDSGEPWADAAIAEAGASEAWAAIFAHAATANGAKPGAKWLVEADRNRQAVGDDEFGQRIAGWMKMTVPPLSFTETPPPLPPEFRQLDGGQWAKAYRQFRQENKEIFDVFAKARADYEDSISEKNITLLKGLAWYSSTSDSPELSKSLTHMAEAAFQNVPERGVWAKSAGNAAIWSLGQMPGGVGVGPLARLRTRLRDRSALKLIASSIEAAAKSANMTVDELEDLAVPTGGLDADGTRREVFGKEDGDKTITLVEK